MSLSKPVKQPNSTSSTQTTIIIVEKTGALKEVVMKKENLTSNLYKKAGFKVEDNFMKYANWNLEYEKKQLTISVYGKTKGRANFENKYEFPPPIDNTLFFGTCCIVAENTKENDYYNLTLYDWNKINEMLFGGFEDLCITTKQAKPQTVKRSRKNKGEKETNILTHTNNITTNNSTSTITTTTNNETTLKYSEEDDENEPDELMKISANKKTKTGYLKDDFVVEDDIDVDADYDVDVEDIEDIDEIDDCEEDEDVEVSKKKRKTKKPKSSSKNKKIVELFEEYDGVELEEEEYLS